MILLAAAVTITIHAAQPVNTFVPDRTFGAGVDGGDSGGAGRTFTPHNIQRMRSAGFSMLTYRLRTELGVEAWHWNPRGTWSDASRNEGYWTSSVAGPLPDSYGDRLPRRGSTTDMANNDGFSRIDDGNARTFWKSNPYLDAAFTHESNDLHPQWIFVDFGRPLRINAIRIAWGEPYATRYEVNYAAGGTGPSDEMPKDWMPFPRHAFTSSGARRIDRLSTSAVALRYIRILLTESCRCRRTPGTSDIRDRVGYAVRELGAGVVDARGRFADRIRHAPSRRQTKILVSSTDPWHTSHDVDHDTEQPGFDRVFASGLTEGRPMLVPVGVLYDTPQNAAAEIASLLARGDPIREVEVGEEPDGQYVTPEDYGALYVEFVDAIRAVAPSVKFGGPSFQTTEAESFTMPIVRGDERTWLRRFLDYLARRGRTADFEFFSFEWYPFDNGCAPAPPQLARHPAILRRVIERLESDGLTHRIPWYITEYGYSAHSARAEVDIDGALMNADIVGLFLTLGGTRAYLYGFTPSDLMDELDCDSWGDNAMFLADDDGDAFTNTAIYWAARMIDQEWVEPGSGEHAVLAVDSSEPLVAAYAVRRPDGKLAVLIINKDPKDESSISIDPKPAGAVDVIRYSREQYRWHANGENGRPARNDPPQRERLAAGVPIVLLPYSVTVVRYDPAS